MFRNRNRDRDTSMVRKAAAITATPVTMRTVPALFAARISFDRKRRSARFDATVPAASWKPRPLSATPPSGSESISRNSASSSNSRVSRRFFRFVSSEIVAHPAQFSRRDASIAAVPAASSTMPLQCARISPWSRSNVRKSFPHEPSRLVVLPALEDGGGANGPAPLQDEGVIALGNGPEPTALKGRERRAEEAPNHVEARAEQITVGRRLARAEPRPEEGAVLVGQEGRVSSRDRLRPRGIDESLEPRYESRHLLSLG